MPRLLSAVVTGAAVILLTGSARAGTEELEGLGFRARPPSGFRVTSMDDQPRGSGRTLRRPATEGGELVLTYASQEQTDAQQARTEMALGRMVEALPGPTGKPVAQPQVNPAKVGGADDAFEVILHGNERVERTLSARQGAVIVHVTLTTPVTAEAEADEVWRTAIAALRLEHPGAGIGTVVVWILLGLVILAVLVTMLKRTERRKVPRPPPPERPAYVSRAPSPTSHAASRESGLPELPGSGHGSSPSASPNYSQSQGQSQSPNPGPGPTGASSTRASDGLPVYTAEEKAAGVPTEQVRRRAPIRPAPLPVQAPAPAPLSRPPSPRPPLPVVKGKS